MIKLVVNADDYAYDENRTLAILRAWKMGAITQTTALVNFPCFEEAIAKAKEAGLFAHMGLHLNLTRGFPLTDDIRKSRLFCDETGEFNGGAFRRTRFGRFWLPEFERRAIKNEAEAQMQKYVETGAPLMHLDSHHHVHTDLSIARIVLPIAKRFGFKTLRRTSNVGKASLTKAMYKRLWSMMAARHIPLASDYFTGFSTFQGQLAQLDGSQVEVMVHPLFGTLDALNMAGELNDTDYPISAELKFLIDNRQRLEVLK